MIKVWKKGTFKTGMLLTFVAVVFLCVMVGFGASIFNGGVKASDTNEVIQSITMDAAKERALLYVVMDRESAKTNNIKGTFQEDIYISNTLPIYNADKQINSYLVEFKDSKKQPAGYVVVGANSDCPPIIEFGYDGKSYLGEAFSQIRNEQNTDISMKNTEIYYDGNVNYYVKSEDQEEAYAISSSLEKITASQVDNALDEEASLQEENDVEYTDEWDNFNSEVENNSELMESISIAADNGSAILDEYFSNTDTISAGDTDSAAAADAVATATTTDITSTPTGTSETASPEATTDVTTVVATATAESDSGIIYDESAYEENSVVSDSEEETSANENSVSGDDISAQGCLIEEGSLITAPGDYEKDYDLCNIFSVRAYWLVYKTCGSFSGYTSHCAPVAGTNMMIYWVNRNPDKYGGLCVSDSWTSTFKKMYTYMGTNKTGTGTTLTGGMNGMVEFFYTYADGAAVGSSTFVGFSKIKAELVDDYPCLIWSDGHDYYGDHAFFCVGYREYQYTTSLGIKNYSRYLRVVDGWAATTDRYIHCTRGYEANGGIHMIKVRPN